MQTSILWVISMLIFQSILWVILAIAFMWLVKFITFKIFSIKNNFLDAMYFASISFFIKFFKFIITIIFIIIYGIFFTLEIWFLENYTVIILIWSLVVDFILMKKLTNNLIFAIFSIIFNIWVLYLISQYLSK